MILVLIVVTVAVSVAVTELVIVTERVSLEISVLNLVIGSCFVRVCKCVVMTVLTDLLILVVVCIL